MKSYYVYIITNKNNEVLYIGVTSDLKQRIYQHKGKLAEGFSKKYNINLIPNGKIYMMRFRDSRLRGNDRKRVRNDKERVRNGRKRVGDDREK